MDWQDAKDLCAVHGNYQLATVRNWEDESAIHELLSMATTTKVWGGKHDKF